MDEAACAAASHPPSVSAATRALTFSCPACRQSLAADGDRYRCPACARSYGVHAGVPDFRLEPDPYLSFDEDRARTEIVLSALDHLSLEPLLHHYWSFSDITPPPLRALYVRNALLGERRGRRVLRALADGTFATPVRPARVLEIGTGTGNFLLPAAEQFQLVVGTDVGMRWMHVTRRRFRDAGRDEPPLVCCRAEALPFPSASFDLVVMCSTLEFLGDPARAFSECARVLDDGGSLFVSAVNRFSIARDPYAYLWGVGFLPRRWQAPYVRWRRGATYQQIRCRSLPELLRFGRHFVRAEVALADVDDRSLAELEPIIRAQVGIYRALKRLPPGRALLKWIGPEWDVLFSLPKRAEDSARSELRQG